MIKKYDQFIIENVKEKDRIILKLRDILNEDKISFTPTTLYNYYLLSNSNQNNLKNVIDDAFRNHQSGIVVNKSIGRYSKKFKKESEEWNLIYDGYPGGIKIVDFVPVKSKILESNKSIPDLLKETGSVNKSEIVSFNSKSFKQYYNFEKSIMESLTFRIIESCINPFGGSGNPHLEKGFFRRDFGPGSKGHRGPNRISYYLNSESKEIIIINAGGHAIYGLKN